MMTPTSSCVMAASPWYHACCSWRKRSPTATTPSEPKTIPGSCVDDAGGSEATSVSTPKARNGRGSSPCSSRAIDDFPELDAPLRTITALRTPTTVAQVGPRPMANCFPAGPTSHDAQSNSQRPSSAVSQADRPTDPELGSDESHHRSAIETPEGSTLKRAGLLVSALTVAI